MPTTRPEPSLESVVTLSTGNLIPCPGCGQPFEPRRPNQRHCSAKCRAAAFTKGREAKRQERDAGIRLLLRTAMEALQEARERLIADPHPHKENEQ